MSQTYHGHTILEDTTALAPYYPYDEDDVEHYYSNTEDGGLCGVLENINMSVHYQITISHPIYFKDLNLRSREIFKCMEDIVNFIKVADRFKLYTVRNITFIRHLQEMIIDVKSKIDEAINVDNNYAVDFRFDRVGLDIARAAFLINAKRKLQLLPPVSKIISIPRYRETLKPKEICPICYSEEYSEKNYMVETICGHKFHVKCMHNWFDETNTCPMCRTAVDEYDVDVHRLTDDEFVDFIAIQTS